VPELRDAVIVATARTPMGRYGGQLKDVRPDDLAAVALKEAVARAGVKPEEVADALTLSGTEVERIIDLGVGWDGVVVARVIESPLVPGSDHLKVLQLEVGDDRVQVVSAAPNIADGDLVPLARPGTSLPTGLTVSARKFMGVVSEGMVCSAMELGITSEADGILVLGREGPSGVPLTDLMPNDRVLVVETTTNRPDLLCHLGVLRELAAVAERAGLGPRNLRADTAALVGLSIALAMRE